MTLVEIELKKELGFNCLVVERALIMIELGNKEFYSCVKDSMGKEKKYTVKIGEFGSTKEEREFLATFNHDHIIPSSPKPTFDIKFEDKLEIDFRKVKTRDEKEIEKLKRILRAYIPNCIEVINYFMLAFRKVKIEIASEHTDFSSYPIIESTKGFLRRELEESLFYRLRWDSECLFGHLGDGQVQTSRQLNEKELQQIQKYFEDRVDIPIRLILWAREYHASEDHRMALLNAAMSLEMSLIRFLREKLSAQCRGISKSQIDKFIKNTSKRLLATVVLSILTKIDVKKLDDCRELLDKRNGIVHGEKHGVKPKEAFDAILLVEEISHLLKIELSDS